MEKSLLQEIFGNSPAKIYTFAGEVVAESHIIQHITEKFAQAAGTNLVSCVISNIQGTYFVYTKDDYNINSLDFNFVVDLPLPEPEPEGTE